MLHPKQFEVNEAWIAFRVNDAPIRTERDGDFNCVALMDAASCFILGMELISAAAAEPTQAQFRRLLKNAKSHKKQLPKTLFVAREDVADRITQGKRPAVAIWIFGANSGSDLLYALKVYREIPG